MVNKKGLRKMFRAAEEVDSSRRIHWGHEDVLNLVAKVGEHWHEFCDGVRKKKFIWKDIATELGHEGFMVNGDECDRKWRNLKIRYLAVLEKQLAGEKSGHRIDYFEGIHSFLKDDPVTRAYIEQRNLQQCSKELGDCSGGNDADFSNAPGDVSGLIDWTDRAIQLLLDLLLEFRDWFSDQETDRDDTTIWETISEQMKLEGHQPSPEQCQQKWTNLAMEFQHHKSEAEATGSLPLWPYYTRVRHVLTQVGVPLLSSTKTPKKVIKRSRNSTKINLSNHCKQEVQNVDDSFPEEPTDSNMGMMEPDTSREPGISGKPSNTSTGSIQPGEIREVCQRLQNIEENMDICRRLDHLEAQLDNAAEQRKAQHQTNTLLTQVLSELSCLRRTLSTRYTHKGPGQDSTDLASGITIVVPQSQQLQ